MVPAEAPGPSAEAPTPTALEDPDLLFLVFTFLGSVITATNILDFSDLMILGMAFPNILGVLMLSGKVRQELTEYTAKLKSGEIQPIDG